MGVTIGVIGLGRIGSFHADTLSRLDNVDGLVVTDECAEVTATVAAKFDADAATDAADVLAADIDGVVIAAATPAHAGLIVAAAEAGIPVFCEKPIVLPAIDSGEVVQRLARSSVPVQIGFNRRFDPAFAAARAAVAAGELGSLHTVRSTTLDPTPPHYVAASGGTFRDCAIHDFDVVLWVVGAEVAEVYVTGSNHADRIFADRGDVDTAASTLTFDDGPLGVVANTRDDDCRPEVHGSVDSVVAGRDRSAPVRSLEPGTEFPNGPAHTFFMDRFTAAYRAELVSFLDVIAGTIPSPCTAPYALEAAWIAESAAFSLQQHRPIEMSEVRR